MDEFDEKLAISIVVALFVAIMFAVLASAYTDYCGVATAQITADAARDCTEMIVGIFK